METPRPIPEYIATALRNAELRKLRCFANPNLTHEQFIDVSAQTAAVQLSLYRQPQVALDYFIEDFNKLTDSLMLSTEPPKKK